MKNYNENLERVLTAIFGLIGMIAIFINLHLKGYGTQDWLDAIKDLAGLVVVLAVFIVTIKIRRGKKTYSAIGREQLVKLCKRYPDFLLGPRFNRDNYDPEKGQGMEYLFVTNADPKSTKRAKLIPVQPFDEGILAIYIQKGTLAYGLNFGEGKVKDEDVVKLRKEIHDLIAKLVESKYNGFFEILPDSKDAAIMVDFYEDKMSKKLFARAIAECAEAVTVKLKQIRDTK
ncbi:MAG: hypothetical protein NTW16_09140 [Bacteroidetes bacterium]|nr:hypothetical protein [Bacteroidota bacterium]